MSKPYFPCPNLNVSHSAGPWPCCEQWQTFAVPVLLKAVEDERKACLNILLSYKHAIKHKCEQCRIIDIVATDLELRGTEQLYDSGPASTPEEDAEFMKYFRGD